MRTVRSLRFHLAAALCGLLLAAAFRLALPEPPDLWGVIDDATAAIAFYGLLLAAAAVGPRAGRVAAVAIAALACAAALLNGGYFAFYRGFVNLDSVYLWRYAGEAKLSAAALVPPLRVVLVVALGAASLPWLLAVRWPRRRDLALPATVAAGFVVTLQGVHDLRPVRTFQAKSESVLAHALRAEIELRRIRLDRTHLAMEARRAMDALLPPRPGYVRVDDDYPLYAEPEEATLGIERPTNVVLVVLESVRASEMGAYGREPSATPNLDALAAQGLFARRFYSNATQTIRAETALLCGLFDRLGGAPFATTRRGWDASCLPGILDRFGYSTHWVHGYDRQFFNRHEFMPQIGFTELHDRDALAPDLPESDRVGWGLADHVMLERALDILEATPEPFFAELLTLSNHFPFDARWPIEFPEGLADGDDLYAAYRRGIYYTDWSVGRFWERFEQSPLRDRTIVVFVGDHGVWLFDSKRGAAMSDFERHEQYFRVPFIAVGPGIEPHVVDLPVSQIDVAPTILSWLGLRTPRTFLGRAFAGADAVIEPAPVFTLIEGAYGVRRGSTSCVPTGRTCYRNMPPYCREGETPAVGRVCVESDEDLLLAGGGGEIAALPVEGDLELPDVLMRYLQSALDEARFTPPSVRAPVVDAAPAVDAAAVSAIDAAPVPALDAAGDAPHPGAL